MMDEEIRQALSEVREMKKMCGNINMKLTNIVTQRGQNWKEKLEAEYQRGLEDAWEAARKLFSSMADSDIEKAFPTEWNNGGFNALINLQPQEAIAKLKAYEKKQSDKIKVGDEVVSKHSGIKGILLEPETEDVTATIIVPSQRWRTIYDAHVNLKKTGKHYDIEKLLEAMKA